MVFKDDLFLYPPVTTRPSLRTHWTVPLMICHVKLRHGPAKHGRVSHSGPGQDPRAPSTPAAPSVSTARERAWVPPGGRVDSTGFRVRKIDIRDLIIMKGWRKRCLGPQ